MALPVGRLDMNAIRAQEAAGPRGKPPMGFDRWADYDWYVNSGEQAKNQAAQTQRDTRDSAVQAAQTKANYDEAVRLGLSGPPSTSGTSSSPQMAAIIAAEKAKSVASSAQQQKAIDAGLVGGAQQAGETAGQYNARRNELQGWGDTTRQQFNYDTLNKEKDPTLNALAAGKTPEGYRFDTQNQTYRRSDSSGTPRASSVTPAGAVYSDIQPGKEAVWKYADSTTSPGERAAQSKPAQQSQPVGAFAQPAPQTSTPQTYKPTSTDKASGPSGFKSFAQENEMAGPVRYAGKPLVESFKPIISDVGGQWNPNQDRGYMNPPPGPVGSPGTPGGSLVPQGWASDRGYMNPQAGPVGTAGTLGASQALAAPQAGTLSAWNPTPISTATPGSYAPAPTFNASGGTTSTGTQIDPNNSLRTQQFLPGSTQNPYDVQALSALNAVQGANVQNPYDVQAAGALGGANMPTEFSPMVGETRDMIMNRLRGLSGPDRTQLAKEAFDIFQQQNEPRYQQELRGVGQKAAALGRVGAGLTTNELTDVWSQRNRDLDLMQRGLINEAAGQTLQDRLNTLQGTLSGSGTLEGQDFGRQSAAANLALNRAGQYGQLGQNQYNREFDRSQLGMQKAGFLQGMGQDQWGRGQQNYQQNTQERAYQDYLARTAVEDRIRQQEIQQRQAQDEWERNNRANLAAASIASGQQTQYPNIVQPQGDSFGIGQMAGAGAPTYPGGGAPSFFEPGPSLPPAYDPGSVFFGNQGLGLQDPANRRFQADPNSIFRNQRFGLEE